MMGRGTKKVENHWFKSTRTSFAKNKSAMLKNGAKYP